MPANTGGALPEIDYGYKYMIHNRPIGQSVPNYQSISIYKVTNIISILDLREGKDYFHLTIVDDDG